MAGPGPGDQDEHYDFLFKLVLVGDASVGKTCVVQRFKTGAFSARQGSTIGVDFTMKTLEIQGKRVKVGGGAARCFCAPGGRFLASPSASPSFGTGLGLDVRTGFRSESTALGSGSGDSRRPERGGGSLPPSSRRGDSSEITCGGRQPAGRSVSAAHARTDPSLRGPLGSTQPDNDIPVTVTGRDQEVVAARTGGPKVFVRISSRPRLLAVSFRDLVVELDSARASAGWGVGGPPQLGFDRNRKLHRYRKMGERTKLWQ